MKIVNKCIVLNEDESRIAAECLAFTEHEFIKTLSSRHIGDFVANDAGKKKALDMCRRLKEINVIVGNIADEGAWPKGSVFTPPFSKEMRDSVSKMDDETLLSLFVNALKNEKAP